MRPVDRKAAVAAADDVAIVLIILLSMRFYEEIVHEKVD